MKTVQDACKLRKNILNASEHSYALNLTDFSKERIGSRDFFDENYITEGMDQLIRIAFDRFQSKSDTALIKLTQAMGGGKTHNMITLGLLAKHSEFRSRVREADIQIDYKDKVRVIGFSGREWDVKSGIWGDLARQLGKFEEFSPYYSGQLQAPGRPLGSTCCSRMSLF
jgi:predicted AAA+ superfamily ATPase